jgi:hypothetical protein
MTLTSSGRKTPITPDSTVTYMVTLDSTPLAANVVIGGTAAMPVLWHEVPLPDLTNLIPKLSVPPRTEESSEQVISLLLSPHEEKVDCYSVYAAQQGISNKIGVKRHPYDLVFALTDYKLQGRTLPKLIISLCKRVRMSWMTLQSFYVLISRVESLEGLLSQYPYYTLPHHSTSTLG